MFLVYSFLLFSVLGIFFWPFIILFHELGHALSAILLTKEKVTVYIGTYGDPKSNSSLKIGRLKIYFHYNPFSWKTGLCQFDNQPLSLNRRIIIVLLGPLFSFVTTIVAGYFAFAFNFHGSIKLLVIVFFLISAWDLIRNLAPNKVPIELYNGGLTYNDGFQIKYLLYRKIFLKDFESGIKFYESKKYSEAASSLRDVLKSGKRNKDMYGMAISSYILCYNFIDAKHLVDHFLDFGGMTSEDNANAGLIYSRIGLYEESLVFYNKTLQANSDHRYALINKGYALMLLSRYEEAIQLFNKALELYPSLAYSYSNMGLSKIKLGQYEEGLANIYYSIELDANCPFGYLNLGIYHFDKGEYVEAVKLFKKAKEIDDTTHLVDDWITNAEKNRSTENLQH